MIQRQLKHRILHLSKHFPAIALIGPRQVGKTTLAKMLMHELPHDTEYIDLENPADLVKLTNPMAYFSTFRDKCIIIDEVQRKPELFPILRSVIDQHRIPSRFLLLGSASPDLLQLSSETLAGRIVYIELTSLNYYEVHSISSMNAHWISGGFPEPFLQQDATIRSEWFNAFIMTYIERDLPSLGLHTVPQNLSRFITMLAHSHGHISNKSSLSKALEVSVPTITKYLNYLEHAFLVRTLRPFYINIKKRLIKSPKVYIRDSGLLHHLLKIQDYETLLGHPIIGHSWEGYVIEQIISILGNQFDYFFYRTQDGAECDLILTEKFNPVACVEIKFTETPRSTKSLMTALHDIQTKQNYIIVPHETSSYPLSENLIVCGLTEFVNRFSPDLF